MLVGEERFCSESRAIHDKLFLELEHLPHIAERANADPATAQQIVALERAQVAIRFDHHRQEACGVTRWKRMLARTVGNDLGVQIADQPCAVGREER